MSLPLTLRRIAYQYPQKTLFEDFNFTFEAGIYPITGSNGIGKSTFLSMLSGIAAPNIGNIFLGNKPLYPNPYSLKHQIGLAPTQPFFASHLDIKENLSLIGLSRSLNGLKLKKNIARCIELTKLNGLESKYVGVLSDGYIKRLLIAQAILHQPRYVLLDEPFANLDSEGEQMFYELINILDQEGHTIIFTTPNIDTLPKQISQIWRLTKNSLQNIKDFECRAIIKREKNEYNQTLPNQSK